MSHLRDQLMQKAAEFALERGRSLTRFLGDGNDGAVWESDQQTAIKALERRDSYFRERDSYLRLRDLSIVDIQGFAVPWLIDHDDTKQVVEMTVVFPPCNRIEFTVQQHVCVSRHPLTPHFSLARQSVCFPNRENLIDPKADTTSPMV